MEFGREPDTTHSNFRLADMITIMNGVCGTLSIFSSARYLAMASNLPGPPSQQALNTLYFAHLLPILGFGFDALDGKVARWRGGGSMLGQEMDSLADLISFGVAPATLAFTLGLRNPLDCLALILFVSAGLARLARFNATVALIPSDAAGKSKYFEGLPIPSSLFLTSMMAYWVKMGWHVLGKRGGSDVPLGTRVLFGAKGGAGEVSSLPILLCAIDAALTSLTDPPRIVHLCCVGGHDGVEDAQSESDLSERSTEGSADLPGAKALIDDRDYDRQARQPPITRCIRVTGEFSDRP